MGPRARSILTTIVMSILSAAVAASAGDYPIVDTAQTQCYDNLHEITPPSEGQAFYGQDAQYEGAQPSHTLSDDGLTVYDNVTGLTWMASPDGDGDGVLESPEDKMSWWDAVEYPATLNSQAYGGYADWRLPSIKELYSLIDFRGEDPSGPGSVGSVPFIDTDYFGFVHGNEDEGERIIDSQYWTATEYEGLTMGGDHTVFGVNFADGRIKGYPTSDPMSGGDKLNFALCCRGNTNYGVNDLVDDGDDTVTDSATGLMWQRSDSGYGMVWEDALAYAEALDLADHDDWRLPNAKELQSIVDYTRCPQTTDTPAIDPVFWVTGIINEGGEPGWPFYWTSTTHATEGSGVVGEQACYVCFGEALGWMQAPFPPYDHVLMDVHGAGAQRCEVKTGDPLDYPYGFGPQGDVVRIYNYVRCVRDVDGTGVDGDSTEEGGAALELSPTPNPFRDRTTLKLTLPTEAGDMTCRLYDASGRLLQVLEPTGSDGGLTEFVWDGTSKYGGEVASGVFFARVVNDGDVLETRLVKLR